MTEHELDRLRAVRKAASSGLARRLRVEAGLSQMEIAGAVGVSQASVAMWEVGKRSPRGAPALKYADLLDALSRDPISRVGSAATA